MRIKYETKVFLDPEDEVFVTTHEKHSGTLSIHNTGYCLNMPEETAETLACDILASMKNFDKKEGE